MKRIFQLFLLMITFLFLLTTNAISLPIGNALQEVFDDIATDGSNDVNVHNDMLADESDSYWNITATGGSIASFIIELAGYAGTNTFGIYNNDTYIELFSGDDTTSNKAVLSINSSGGISVTKQDINGFTTGFANYGNGTFSNNTFGYYLDSRGGDYGGLWHSDTSLNNDGADHMLAYRGVGEEVDVDGSGAIPQGIWTSQEFILAFEDLGAEFSGFDQDYADMVVMVESVAPVPEPATMVLFGMGLLGLAGITRKKLR